MREFGAQLDRFSALDQVEQGSQNALHVRQMGHPGAEPCLGECQGEGIDADPAGSQVRLGSHHMLPCRVALECRQTGPLLQFGHSIDQRLLVGDPGDQP